MYISVYIYIYIYMHTYIIYIYMKNVSGNWQFAKCTEKGFAKSTVLYYTLGHSTFSVNTCAWWKCYEFPKT